MCHKKTLHISIATPSKEEQNIKHRLED